MKTMKDIQFRALLLALKLLQGIAKAFLAFDILNQHHPSSPTNLKVSASELLYQDQQQAMHRRAIAEDGLLCEIKRPQELIAPKLKPGSPKSGTGFANTAAMNKATRLAAEQAKVVKRDGVLRINNVLAPELSKKLRLHLLEQQQIAEEETTKDSRASPLFYGVEQARKNRCDMHLSLSKGGIRISESNEPETDKAYIVADVLQEILGSEGTLKPLYEALVSREGEFYELAAIITNPGSDRQMIHPDLPYQTTAPLVSFSSFPSSMYI
jgi:hypothetical protein